MQHQQQLQLQHQHEYQQQQQQQLQQQQLQQQQLQQQQLQQQQQQQLQQQQQQQLQQQQQPTQQQPQPQPQGNAGPAPMIETIQVAARYGPAASSRIGSLFWPHMVPTPPTAPSTLPASSRKRSRTDAGLTEDDRRLEAELGLRRTAKAKPAPSAKPSAAASPNEEARTDSATFVDSLPSTRAATTLPPGRWWMPASHDGAKELRQRGKLPADDSRSPPVVTPTSEGVLCGLITEELTCAMLRPATAAVLIRTGFDRTQASALETLAEVRRLPACLPNRQPILRGVMVSSTAQSV